MWGAVLSLPTGGQSDFYGSRAPALELRAIAEVHLPSTRPALRIGALAGLRAAFEDARFFDATWGTDAHLGLALDAHVPRRIADRFHALVELESYPRARFLEMRGALRARLPAGLSLDLGAGGGLLHSPGNPAYRVFLIARWDG